MKSPEEIHEAVAEILAEADPNIKALRLSGLLTALFRENGYDPVIVGGSAIEFYTEGAYLSGDIDICFDGKRPSPVDCAKIIGEQLGGIGSVRTWKIGDLYVDVLGEVEAFADEEKFGILETPEGPIRLQPIEDLVAERVFSARGWTQPHQESEDCARKLIAAILMNGLPIDWKLAESIADSPAYRCGDHLRAMRAEVESELERE